MTIVENRTLITGGVDTHLEFHVAAAVDANGGTLAVATFDACTFGYRELHRWSAGFGPIEVVGVEGTGSYGAGLARFLRSQAVAVVEVDRPNRQLRSREARPMT